MIADKKRVPGFYIKNNEMTTQYRTNSLSNFATIGPKVPLSMNVYHKVELKQIQEGSNWKIKVFFDDILAGEKINVIPEVVYSDVRVYVAQATGGAEYLVKEVEIFKNG